MIGVGFCLFITVSFFLISFIILGCIITEEEKLDVANDAVIILFFTMMMGWCFLWLAMGELGNVN